jgi:hypothetical protein
MALFAYRGSVEGNTPALTKLFQETLPGTVRSLTSGDLDADGKDELVVVTIYDSIWSLHVLQFAAEADLGQVTSSWIRTWTAPAEEGWSAPVIGDALGDPGDPGKEIWVHSQIRDGSPNPPGKLLAFDLNSSSSSEAVFSIPGLGGYDRFTVGPVAGEGKDIIALFKIGTPPANTVEIITPSGVRASNVLTTHAPSVPTIAHNKLYITGHGSGGKATGSFLLQVFGITRTVESRFLLELVASRVAGARGEIEPTDLAVVP